MSEPRRWTIGNRTVRGYQRLGRYYVDGPDLTEAGEEVDVIEATGRLAVFTDAELDQIVVACARAYDEGDRVSDRLWNEVLGEFERRGRRVPTPYD